MSVNYPIKFIPILKEKIWGGTKLNKLLRKSSKKKNIGESWEISAVDTEVSIVANGILKGQTLNQIITKYTTDLLGKKVYHSFGNTFPLLIKFIDANKDLSIQLHPNDALAKKRHNTFGKTEMWYVMQADKAAKLIVGFKKDIKKELYLKKVKENKLLEVLNQEAVKTGDVYYIETGTIHAICAGVLLAEIQQTSDVTYRIFDWNRKDAQGNQRELHTELALAAINFSTHKTKIDYQIDKRGKAKLIECPYFTTNLIKIKDTITIDISDRDSFIVYMCVSGKATFLYGKRKQVTIKKGATLLIPAALKHFRITSEVNTTLLEIYIA